MFPCTFIDNFYSDPDEVRDFALKQEFIKGDDGRWPGSRTLPLHELNPKLFNSFCQRLFGMFYDFNKSQVEWEVQTCFQMIERFSDDPLSPKNTGWVHVDGDVVFAGIVYLSKEIDKNAGTSLFRLKDPTNLSKLNDDCKAAYYRDGIDNDYDRTIQLHNACFEESARFYNFYNNMLLIPQNTWHGVNSYYTEGEPRLTQVFFVKSVTSDSGFPLGRS